jgi:hypothetical protein
MPVTLLGATWEPKLPPSYTVRAEIVFQQISERDARGVATRGLAAALGATWAHPDPKQRLPRYEQFEDPASYGKAIFDELQARGVSLNEILEAGRTCIRSLDAGIITSADVQARADFSAASPEPSASGSGPAESAKASAPAAG